MPATAYDTWINQTWSWGASIILPLSTLVIIGAAYIIMTSGGDATRVAKGKKMILGVLSGLGFLLLSYFIITQVIGINITLFGGSIW
jgi:hypothetical protein